jgi:hypothetical protein
MAITLKTQDIAAVPGWKLCSSCYKRVHCINKELKSIDQCYSRIEPEQEQRSSLNESLGSIGVSPIKLKSIPKHQRLPAAKRKFDQITGATANKIKKVYDIDPMITLTPSCTPLSSSIDNQIDDLYSLLNELKDKIKNVTSYSAKIQILTLTPESWSLAKSAEFFNVSNYLVREARKAKKKHGILHKPSSKKGKSLSHATIDLVHSFYQSDEYTRMLPGKKDFVSIGYRQHMQKRLILINLKELYVAFKFQHSNLNVGFSKFCSLRPRWCITTNSSGTHCVCVCTYHQNVKLLTDALKIDKDYRDLMEMIVCNRDNVECMLHRCPLCPGIAALKEFLTAKFDNSDKEITINQWQHTDRTTLINQKINIEDVIDLICNKIDKLTSHSLIAKSQAKYLKDCKELLNQNECIVLGDFAENFQFIVQDEVQSYHWNKPKCTLHPIIIYYKSNDKLLLKSFCILSDDAEHDVYFVYKIQQLITNYIKANILQISNIKYFTDGCAAQYKNFKNFINLCHHKEDFDIDAEWVFFATSHGKSACDGIGGTVKRLTAQASLKRTVTGQILEVDKMFEFCVTNIKNIQFILVYKIEINEVRSSLQPRFTMGRTLPGTRSFHHFIPIDKYTISFKRMSQQTDVQTFKLVQIPNELVVQQVIYNHMDYVACMYDSFWWIGIINKKDEGEGDYKIQFMHPHGPSPSFSWPAREDMCWVPSNHILCTIDPPSTTNGRVYKISEIELAKIIEQNNQDF